MEQMKRVWKVLSQAFEGSRQHLMWRTARKSYIATIGMVGLTVISFLLEALGKDMKGRPQGFSIVTLVALAVSGLFLYVGWHHKQKLNRATAGEMIARLSRTSDPEQVDVWWGTDHPVDDILAHLEQLTPEGLKYIELYSQSLGIVPKAKAKRPR